VADIPQAIHGKAIEQACEDDRLWFDAHPEQKLRLRHAVPYEFNGLDQVATPGYLSLVFVVLLGPGLRLRVPTLLPTLVTDVVD
jgi:hypothetical protein